MPDLAMNLDDRLIFDADAGGTTYLRQTLLENLFELFLDGTRVAHAETFGTAAAQDRALLLRAQDSDGTLYAMPLDRTGEAIQTAVDSLPNVVSNGLVVLPAGDYVLQNTGIVVERHQVTLRGHGARLLVEYAGNAPALWMRNPGGQAALLGFSLSGNVRIVRQQQDPATGVGLRLENVMAAALEGFSVEGFSRGVHLLGNLHGCGGNRLMLREVRDCTVGVTLEDVAPGYVNQNTFIGGRFLTNEAMGGGASAAHLEIQNNGGDPNGNHFLHLSLEGFSTNTTRAVVCGGVANTFTDLRNELVGHWEFTASSARNLVMGGRGIVPNSFLDDGTGNAVYLIEEFHSHERVIATNVVLSGTLAAGSNPTRGRQRIFAMQSGQALPAGPNPDPALADTGGTGMLCVTPSGDLVYVSPDGRKTRLARG